MATPSSVTTWVLLFIVLGYGESKYNGSNDAGGTVDRIQQQSLGSMSVNRRLQLGVIEVESPQTQLLGPPSPPHRRTPHRTEQG